MRPCLRRLMASLSHISFIQHDSAEALLPIWTVSPINLVTSFCKDNGSTCFCFHMSILSLPGTASPVFLFLRNCTLFQLRAMKPFPGNTEAHTWNWVSQGRSGLVVTWLLEIHVYVQKVHRWISPTTDLVFKAWVIYFNCSTNTPHYLVCKWKSIWTWW